MQKMYYSPMTERKIEKRFGSHQILYGKLNEFPNGAEREYIRVMNWYMREIWKAFREELPELQKEYKAIHEKDMRTDSVFDMSFFLDNFFDGIMKKLDKLGIVQNMVKRLFKIGTITKEQEISIWKRQVHRTLGLDIYEDYYRGDFFKDILETWVSENVDLISTIPHDMLGKMKKTILQGYEQGLTSKEIAQRIREDYDITEKHAQFIARDQMAKLNSRITRKEQEDAGVEKYMWSDSGDQRVRKRHRRLNGHVFRWDDPPETDGGRHCHPGEDYNCRCAAISGFELGNINLPLKDDSGDLESLFGF